ncbi:GroES-like protein [Trametes elegans]|nr:GroES-like protein [Trametes elegans]
MPADILTASVMGPRHTAGTYKREEPTRPASPIDLSSTSQPPTADNHIDTRRITMPVPATQKALVLPKKGGEWTVADLPVPTPGPKDVLVKVTAAALNPADWKIQAFGWDFPAFPVVGGFDGAGIVEAVGADVTSLAKGDRIVFQGWLENPKAAFQQYAAVPADLAAKIPDNISFDQAASIPVALATFVTGTYNHHPQGKTINIPAPWEEGGTTAHAGKPALILGGASSVGQYAIQLAKLSGFSPIITTASPHNEQLLRSLGAAHVLDRTLSPAAILAELPKLTQGKPLEFVFDAIAVADTQALGYDALAPGGALIVVNPDEVPAEKKKAAGESKRVVNVFGIVHLPENREVGVELFKRLTEWLEKGIIVPNRVEVLPNGLAGIPEGLERLKNNKVSGKKLVARPQETP